MHRLLGFILSALRSAAAHRAFAVGGVLAFAAATSRAQPTTYYVNRSTGNDVCNTGQSPILSGACTDPPSNTAPGPFRTITRAVTFATALPAGSRPVTILVAGTGSGIYDTALGEVFPIVMPERTLVRYDAANSTAGVLVRVVAPASAFFVFDFTAVSGLTYSAAESGLDGSTLGTGTQAITVEGAVVGCLVRAQSPASVNSLSLANVRFWRSASTGVHVIADAGSSGALAYANPTISLCLFTHDTAPGTSLVDQLLVEANDY